MQKKRINTELIEKLAGYGPNCTAKPTEANLARLADPHEPLIDRVSLLQDIAGGPVHYEEAAAILDEDIGDVMHIKVFLVGDRPGDNVAECVEFNWAA